MTREVHPIGRFEWERIVLACRLDGVFPAKRDNTGAARDGVSGHTFKLVSLTFATHADGDGSRIFPSDARVALETELSIRSVKAVRRRLIDLGLLTSDGRQGRANRYRLTMPSDITEHLHHLSPSDMDKAVRDLTDRRRGSRTPGVGGTRSDPPSPEEPDPAGGTRSDPPKRLGGTRDDTLGVRVATPYQPETNHTPTTQEEMAEVRTAVTLTRATRTNPENRITEKEEETMPDLSKLPTCRARRDGQRCGVVLDPDGRTCPMAKDHDPHRA